MPHAHGAHSLPNREREHVHHEGALAATQIKHWRVLLERVAQEIDKLRRGTRVVEEHGECSKVEALVELYVGVRVGKLDAGHHEPAEKQQRGRYLAGDGCELCCHVLQALGNVEH